MDNFKHKPLEGLLYLNSKEISNASIVDVFSYAEEKINASPNGRTKKLALLFYFIKILNDSHLNFYVKGGIILQYYLKEKARPTEDLDIIIPGDIDLFYSSLEKALSNINGPLSFKIVNFKKNYADAVYYYDTFNIRIDVFYEGEKYSQIVVDAISSLIFNKIDSIEYKGPEIFAHNFLFKGVPIEYVMAEKVIAVTNELKRPFKHLVDLFSLIQLDINIELLRKYVALINDNDNQIRKKLNIAHSNVYQIRDDKPFADSYLFPLLQAGYQIDFDEIKEAINNWFNTNLK